MIKAVLFDMDGLMFDTERMYHDSWLELGRQRGLAMTEALVAGMRGRNREGCVALCKAAFGPEFDFMELRGACVERMEAQIAAKGLPKRPGLDELLEELARRDLPAVLGRLRGWMGATGPGTEYVVRFGVVQLMELFLGDAFEAGQLELVARIDRPEYYINMARAWYFSFALIKQPEATLPMFERPVLDAWTHNKALQKARESRRVAPERKAYLQSLKVPTR